MLKATILLAVASLSLVACSKSDKDPQLFLPRIMNAQGEDLSAARAKACDSSKVNLTDNVLTKENFQAMFACANYDHSLNELQPLITSEHFPKLLESLNLIMKSDNTKSLRDTLREWLQDGPQGTSRVDRLLPFLSSLVKNRSFQDFLPVLSNILQNGRSVWNDLLPGMADVVYTELFPDNLENAFVVISSFSGNDVKKKDEAEKDYAKSIKDLANFMKSTVDGKTVSVLSLELLNQVRDLQPDGTSLFQFIEHMLEFGSIDEYFMNSGASRGEVTDPKLNDSADDPAVACPDLNDTPEHRMQCSYERLFKHPADGNGEAPITQLAMLVTELQNQHPDLLPALAGWFSANGPRVINGLSGYVVRAQVVTSLSKLNVATYLQQFALKSGMDPDALINSDQLATLIKNGFSSPDYPVWVATILPAINKAAFGERNAGFLTNSTLPTDIATLYSAPELQAFAKVIIPDGATATLTAAVKKFSFKHRTDSLSVNYNGKQQSMEKHLGDFWVAVVKSTLGEDVVLTYVVKLAQTLVTQLANDFKDKNQPIAEWYFNSPYGNPGSTEMIVGYAIKELDLLSKYYKNKDWLMNDFTNEAFSNDDDKRAFRLLLDQIPNIVLYVRSGMSRTGGDLTRAMAKDTNGYLVRTYVNLLVKATNTGWVRKGVRLIEAYQQRPGRTIRVTAPVSDDIVDRRNFKLGVEALERIIRSLIQPEQRDDYSTTTLSRLLVPISSIVSDARRNETERFMTTSADEILRLSDQQINDFMRDLNKAKPPGTAGDRRETYRSVADMMRNKSCPDLILHLAGLFQEDAVRPALNFLATKIDDGSLPKVLLFIRRMLGFGR